MKRSPGALLTILCLFAPEIARADEWLVDFDGRGAIGVGTHFDEPQARVALELGIGLRIGLERAPKDAWVTALIPELSLSGLAGDGFTDAGFVGGLGLGRTDGTFLLGVIPGFVWNTEKGPAIGSHEGYGGRLLFTAEIMKWLGIQAAYQVVSYRGMPLVHEVRATASLNFIGIAIAILLTHKGGSF